MHHLVHQERLLDEAGRAGLGCCSPFSGSCPPSAWSRCWPFWLSLWDARLSCARQRDVSWGHECLVWFSKSRQGCLCCVLRVPERGRIRRGIGGVPREIGWVERAGHCTGRNSKGNSTQQSRERNLLGRASFNKDSQILRAHRNTFHTIYLILYCTELKRPMVLHEAGKSHIHPAS